MAKIDVVCHRYSETQGGIRNGHSSSGAQLYQLDYRYNGVEPETHQTFQLLSH
ncbi:Transposase [Shigella dysenteriae WRSd3]|nr:Transposase [Shigella dysenteriae WRSd3]